MARLTNSFSVVLPASIGFAAATVGTDIFANSAQAARATSEHRSFCRTGDP
ncbi:hypothetical protein V1281_007855 [Nitrobacteraceae bacterium AZCC 2161]